MAKNPPASAGGAGAAASIPGRGRIPWRRASQGSGSGSPLQHSCLGNPSRTRLSNSTTITIAGVRSVRINPFGQEARSLVKQDFEPLTRVPEYMTGS